MIAGKTRVLFLCQAAVLAITALISVTAWLLPGIPMLMRLSILPLSLSGLSFVFGFGATRLAQK